MQSKCSLTTGSLECRNHPALAALLRQRGRARFLEELARHGLSKQEQWALADELAAAMRAGQYTDQGPQPAVFDAAAEQMHPVVRSLLVNGADPSTVSASALLQALGRTNTVAHSESLEGDVMQTPDVLSAKACASLRCAVDTERRLECDSVDGAPEHQLNLSREALELLIGPVEAGKLWVLPRVYRLRSAVCNAPSATSTSESDEVRRARAMALKREAVALKRAGRLQECLVKLTEARAAETPQCGSETCLAQSTPVDETTAEGGEASTDSLALCEMFVRRYSLETRP